ncbi:hypothetical protein [Cereibacter sphaeroides]|jgi:hypothetical protein|uniref:hypothetical protein n=1 Tax=Cereibacter sphaeroides TaxID=1063 RepID=UPI001391512A
MSYSSITRRQETLFGKSATADERRLEKLPDARKMMDIAPSRSMVECITLIALFGKCITVKFQTANFVSTQ